MSHFVTRYTSIVIPPGGLSVSVDDKQRLTVSPVTVYLHYDTCPLWLNLAFRHLAEAQRHATARTTAWQTSNDESKGMMLEAEFEASMEAIMAAANRHRGVLRISE